MGNVGWGDRSPRSSESRNEESDSLIHRSERGVARGRASRLNQTRVPRLCKQEEACDEVHRADGI